MGVRRRYWRNWGGGQIDGDFGKVGGWREEETYGCEHVPRVEEEEGHDEVQNIGRAHGDYECGE